MAKILTVVIPAYHVENYIKECLDSFLEPQILPFLEILVVDDGGTDRTMEIARQYELNYPETFHLCFKENGGHGSVINYGIEHATGKYFKVIDGDDWVNTENMPGFIRLLERIDSDIVASDYECIRDGDKKVLSLRKACTSKPEEHYNREHPFSAAVLEPVIKIHSLTVRTDVVRRMIGAGIRMDEHCFYEDAEYIMYPVPFADTVYYDPHVIYEYRLGRDGQSVNIHSMRKNKAQHERVIKSLLLYLDEIKKINEDLTFKNSDHVKENQVFGEMCFWKEKKAYIARGISLLIENQFQIYLSMGGGKKVKQEMIQFDRGLKEKYPEVYESVAKKSVWLLRKSGYRIWMLACIAYRLVKG